MKIKCTFHIAIAFILIQLTDEFSIAFAYGICEKNPYVRILYVTFAIFMAVFIANMLWIHRNARPGDMAHASEQQPSSAEVDSPRVTPAADNRESQ